MARCPFAEWRPLPENRTEPHITATQFFFHSIVGSAEGAYGYFLNSTSLESHFILKKNGDLIQLIDTARQADAQYRANIRGISVETEDNGNPNVDPWTQAQVKKLVRLGNWAKSKHPRISNRIMPRWDAPGFGWHAMFGAPSPLTPVRGKTCPGTVRVRQLRRTVLPAIFGQKEVDVVTNAEMNKIADKVKGDLVPWIQNVFGPELVQSMLYQTRFNLYGVKGPEGNEEAESVNLLTAVARAAQQADFAADAIEPIMTMLQRIESKVNDLQLNQQESQDNQ